MSVRAILIAGSMLASASAWAQESGSIALDYSAAEHRLLERSDALAASDANVQSKEAQVGATRSLGRPEVDFEAQLLDYQKTLYLPLGSLAPVAAAFGIRDPLRFRRQETAVRPIVTGTLPLYTGGLIAGTKAGARAQLGVARRDVPESLTRPFRTSRRLPSA